jgi:predicted nucleic acid-binding protein
LATETYIIDASATVHALLVDGFSAWPGARFAAPTLLWSEVTAALRQLEWRNELGAADVADALDRLNRAPIRATASAGLARDAWRLAVEFGWAKTYDAEYVALAARMAAPLVTLDARLRATASSAVRIIGPTEIA